MTTNDRPLSPHLSIYRWPVTMVSSILHRAAGVAMSVGLVVFAGWLFDAAAGPDVYAQYMDVMDTFIGRVLLVGWSWAFFYHLANGIRHLVWDTGRGLEKGQASVSAWIVIVASIVLTVAFWGVAS